MSGLKLIESTSMLSDSRYRLTVRIKDIPSEKIVAAQEALSKKKFKCEMSSNSTIDVFDALDVDSMRIILYELHLYGLTFKENPKRFPKKKKKK